MKLFLTASLLSLPSIIQWDRKNFYLCFTSIEVLIRTLYQTLTQRLLSNQAKERFQTLGLPPVACVDVFSNEYNNFEPFEHFPLPAVFFDYSISYDQDQGRARIALHLCYQKLRDMSSLSHNRSSALEFFDFIERPNGQGT